ncbi:late histone H1-like [Littorina saxatilis]
MHALELPPCKIAYLTFSHQSSHSSDEKKLTRLGRDLKFARTAFRRQRRRPASPNFSGQQRIRLFSDCCKLYSFLNSATMSSSEDERSSSQSPVKAAAKPRKAPAAARSSVSTINIVTEALEKTEEKKGLSLSGLKSFAVSNYPDLAAQAAFKSRLRKAILKGLENELLIRPAKSKECTGVTGRFKLAKIKPAKAAKPAAKRSQSPSPAKKTAEKGSKPAKVTKPRSRSKSPSAGKAKALSKADGAAKPKAAASPKKAAKKTAAAKKSPVAASQKNHAKKKSPAASKKSHAKKSPVAKSPVAKAAKKPAAKKTKTSA